MLKYYHEVHLVPMEIVLVLTLVIWLFPQMGKQIENCYSQNKSSNLMA
jgi:hypothetical protein